MKWIRYLIATLTAIWLQTAAHAAEIHILNNCAGGYCIDMSGKIIRGDYDRILSIILHKEKLPTIINIESPGGDVIEAIKLGRMIRRGLIRVNPGTTCNSACSFIVFASINHYKSDDEIGLHRPYYEKEYFAGLSLNEAQERYAELDILVTSYLREMGVPTIFSEKIMSISSNKVQYLSLDDYIEIAGSKPPAFDEWLIAQCGSLSTQEIHRCQKDTISVEQEKFTKFLIEEDANGKLLTNPFIKTFGKEAEAKEAAATEEIRIFLDNIEPPPPN